MNDPTLPPEDPASEPEREEKPVAELERGTWIEVIDEDGGYAGEGRVLHVETFNSELGRRSLLLYQMPGFEPDTIRFAADMAVPLLTEDEVAAKVDEERRTALAAQLHALADIVDDSDTPLPPIWRSITVDLDFCGDMEALAGFAKALGVEVRDNGTWLAATREGADDHSAGVVVMGRASKPKAEPTADPTGLLHSRADEADDPTPVSPARVPLHTGAVTDDGLVDETEHRHVGGTAGGPGENSAECACGVEFGGFDTHAEATAQLDLHIEAATSPTGLTRAADESRGPLAGTTPVVTYFSFGHGQTDPGTGQSLLDHYVTVVAPTYGACREAMFASRFGREWSFDYLAGTAKATNWVSRWTEHEVIVADGTDKTLADSALEAARQVLSPEAGERVEVGSDGCGCPITEEVRLNSSSIDGTERVEHRPGCWNAVPPTDPDDLPQPTT